jgi:transcriptional regulator with XRE-family HTH domain
VKWTSHPDLARDLGFVIRQRRDDLQRSQEDVAHEAGLSVRHYAKLESGQTNATIGTLFSVADVLGIDILQLIELAARLKKKPVARKPR